SMRSCPPATSRQACAPPTSCWQRCGRAGRGTSFQSSATSGRSADACSIILVMSNISICYNLRTGSASMNFNPAASLGAVVRKVVSRDHLGKPARVVIAGRRYDTDIDDLWDALTNGERIPRWFLPISGDLKLGGRYQFKGNAGGEITRCEPPRLLAVTWEYGPEVSWLNVTLAAEAAGTRLELEHIAHVSDERWEQFGP